MHYGAWEEMVTGEQEERNVQGNDLGCISTFRNKQGIWTSREQLGLDHGVKGIPTHSGAR